MTNEELSELSIRCRHIYECARLDLGSEIAGLGVLNLCADKITKASLLELKIAISVSGIYNVASCKAQSEIRSWLEVK